MSPIGHYYGSGWLGVIKLTIFLLSEMFRNWGTRRLLSGWAEFAETGTQLAAWNFSNKIPMQLFDF
jgi:hypothetical protein